MHERVVEDVLEAAQAELSAHGPTGVTMRAVARAIDITPSGLYRYVTDHNDLIGLLTVNAYDSMRTALQEARARAPAGDHVTGWFLASLELRRWALANEAHYSLLVCPDVITPRPSTVEEAWLRHVEFWAGICEDAIADGQIGALVAEVPIRAERWRLVTPAPALPLALSGLSALSGHIDIEVRHGFAGLISDAEGHYRDHLLSIMWLMGFTGTPTPDADPVRAA